jgi:mRNA-degrading endonuclease RelE of RelBE toxin-antitoxin system
MNLPLTVQYTKAVEKYLEKMDATTRDRVKKKVPEVAGEPLNVKHSLPLRQATKDAHGSGNIA